MKWIRGSGVPVAVVGLTTSLALAAAFGWSRIVSGSVDITYHLQVLDAVRHGGSVPVAAKAYMAEMYGYPDLGHRAAAALTWLGLGDLNALVLTGCFCAALAWFCLLDQARRVGLAVLALGAVLAVANAWFTGASFGAEIVGNFFFSQMAGEAFAVVALVFGQVVLKRSVGAYAVYAAVAVFLAGCIHLIPALHLAGAAMALLALEGARALLHQRRRLWSVPAGVIASGVALVVNPYAASMLRNSSNDGSVGYAVEFSFGILAFAATALLMLSVWVLAVRWLDQETPGPAEGAASLLAALGAAVAVAILAQLAVLLALHQASAYAVHKQAFGVFSLLCLVLPLWLAEVVRMRRPAPGFGLVLVVAGQVAVVGVLFSRPAVFEVRSFDRLLAETRTLRIQRGLDRSDILFVSEEVRPLISYVLSSAALHRRRDEAAFEVLQTGFPVHADQAGYLATRVGGVYDKPACRDGAPLNGLVVVRTACAAPVVYNFKAGANGTAHLGQGWSGPEAGGTWSVARRALVELPIPAEARAYPSPSLQVGAFGFLPPASPRRTARVSVADGPVEVFTFKMPADRGHVFVLPIPAPAMAEDRLRVTIEVDDPVSPRAPGLGPDDRLLGVGLERMSILPQMRPKAGL